MCERDGPFYARTATRRPYAFYGNWEGACEQRLAWAQLGRVAGLTSGGAMADRAVVRASLYIT